MKKVAVLTLMAISLPLAGALQAQEPDPLGDDFQVNSYTPGVQRKPSVAADAQGNFVVVWESRYSEGTDINQYSIQAQRFDASGTPLGGQFQVNSYWPDDQRYPAVAADSESNFVVVWQSNGSYGNDTSQDSIQAQRYDPTGTPVGGEFQVNTYWTNSQSNPAVAFDPEGNFIVVWGSLGSHGTDTDGGSIQAQRYDSEGNSLGGEFQINSYTPGSDNQPSVATDAQGNFIVAWWASGSSGTDPLSSIQTQRFNSNGLPVGVQFQVNSFTGGYQENPSVAMGAQGNFVVVWESGGSYDLDTDRPIRAKAYDADGNPLGGFFSEFQVNTYGTGEQHGAAVVSDVQGNFVVTWTSDGSYGTDTDNRSVQGQRIAADRSFLGGEFQVNSYTTSTQGGARLAAGPGGNLVVVWYSGRSAGTDTDSGSIQARRFDTALFGDGFEAGDTSAWSQTVP